MSFDASNILGIQFKEPEPEEVRETMNKGKDINRQANTFTKNRCPELEKIYQTSTTHKAYDKEVINEAIESELGKFLELAEASFKQKDKPYFIQNAMSNPKFVKKLLELTENNTLADSKVNDLIHNFFTFHNIFSSARIGEEDYNLLVELYWSAYLKRNIKYIEKIAKKTGVEERVAATVAISVPKNLTDVDRDNYSIQRYTFMLLTNLYSMAKNGLKAGDNAAFDDPTTIRKIIKQAFKHDNPEIVMRTILLERSDKKQELNDNQKAVWSTVDLVVLDWLEDFEPRDLKKFLMDYGFKRLNTHARRLNLQEHISQSDYPNILRTIGEIIEEKPKLKDCFK